MREKINTIVKMIINNKVIIFLNHLPKIFSIYGLIFIPVINYFIVICYLKSSCFRIVKSLGILMLPINSENMISFVKINLNSIDSKRGENLMPKEKEEKDWSIWIVLGILFLILIWSLFAGKFPPW
ncbi:MAG: hypothetical protein COZ04_05510 [Candidatus Aenigmarchaeota archaeon CG_4_10_14_3_um_filter_37_21]|nr:MAG: hypothetical protein COZ04_05510 [Candidatus Aenigmarchaeota archaeon CG_4_10_14_3_um_filter_37_21]